MLRAVVAAVAVALFSAGCAHGTKKRDTFAVRFKAAPPTGHKVTTDDLERSVSIMHQRLERLGISDADVHRQGGDVIVIEFPSPHDASAAGDTIAKTALLEFYDFEADLAGPSASGLFQSPVAIGSLYRLLAAPQTRALARKGAAQWFMFDARRKVARGPTSAKKLLGPARKGSTILAVPAKTVVVTCNARVGNCLSTRQVSAKKGYYLFKHRPELTGADLELSGTRADQDPQTGSPVVIFQFTDRGKRVFQEITRREAQRGALVCAGARSADAVPRCAQHFAIVLDHEIESAPYIDFLRNPDGIPGDNGVQIDVGAGASLREAKRLSLLLRTPALPVQFVRLR